MRTWIVIAVALALGCNTELENSTLTLALMDAPPANVTSVVVQVARIDVHVEPGSADARAANDASIDLDDSWHQFTVNKAIDLAAAQSEIAAVVLGDVQLPDGKITQIRLVFDTVKSSTVTAGGKTCELGLAKLPKTGIKITHPFKSFHVGKALQHKVWIDAPLDQMLVATKTCFDLKPVLKIAKFQTSGKNVTVN